MNLEEEQSKEMQHQQNVTFESQPSEMKQVLPISVDSKILKPSIEEPPQLELKPLPEFLKYVFLGPNNTLPVIISSTLNHEQEAKLLEVLKECKLALGWTIVDIKGVSPTICMYKILMEYVNQ